QRQHDVDGDQRYESVGRDIGSVVTIERTGEAEDAGADGKGFDLEGDHPFAGDTGDLIVIANRPQHAAERRMAQILQQEDGDNQKSEDDRQIDEVEILRADTASPGARNARDT